MPTKYGCILIKVKSNQDIPRLFLYYYLFSTLTNVNWSILLVDGGTAQSCRKSTDVEVDGIDDVDGFESWRSLAEQLRQNLASIILMSEADLQVSVILACYFVISFMIIVCK